MIIGFYNPYFDSYSGGERYSLTLASHWSKTHDVRLFWDDTSILEKSSSRFGIDLARVTTVPNVFKANKVFKKIFVTRGYDVIFFLTDGSIPTSFAKHNILHIQVPFPKFPFSLWKRGRFDAVVANSQFTKANMDPSIGQIAQVIYPPVGTSELKAMKKEKIILSVGRFHQFKKQDVLIDAFLKLDMKDLTLVLAGGLLGSDQGYFDSLKKDKPKNVMLLPNVSLAQLRVLYGKACVYWHAAGFGETNPMNMEHFGITTVEAMTAGAIPLVYNGGGLPEIVDERINGFLWNEPSELIKKTKTIFEKKSFESFVLAAQKKAKTFNTQVFTSAFDEVLRDVLR